MSKKRKNKQNSELKQAYIRTGFFSAGLIYTALMNHSSTTIMIVAVAWFIACSTIPFSLYFCQSEDIKPWRHAYRVITLAYDIIGLSICMHFLGSTGLPFYFSYLWINIGNGMRYGFWYSLLSSGITAVALGIIFAHSDWTHGELLFPFVTVALIVTCIPAYLSFLTRGREYRLKELKERSTELERMVKYDELTQIYNRKAFNEALSESLEHAQTNKEKVAVIIMDIDFFKKYNDNYGHPQGDECLKQFAQILSLSFSHAGDIVARYGGEEFVVILNKPNEHISYDERVQTFHNMLHAKAIEHERNPSTGIVTASVGGFVIEPNNTEVLTAESVMQYADLALYQAKHQGRDRTIWYQDPMPSMDLPQAANQEIPKPDLKLLSGNP